MRACHSLGGQNINSSNRVFHADSRLKKFIEVSSLFKIPKYISTLLSNALRNFHLPPPEGSSSSAILFLYRRFPILNSDELHMLYAYCVFRFDGLQAFQEKLSTFDLNSSKIPQLELSKTESLVERGDQEHSEWWCFLLFWQRTKNIERSWYCFESDWRWTI